MIVGRRQLIGAGVAAAGGLAMPLPAALPARARVLFDPERTEARRFAAAAARLGAAPLPLADDRVRLLAGVLGGGLAQVAGLSTFADYLLAAGIARDHGWRLAGHAEHRAGDHRCGGCLIPASAALAASGEAWPEALPALLLRTDAPARAPASRTGGAAQLLVSWVLTRG